MTTPTREELLKLAKEDVQVVDGLIYALRDGSNYYEINVTMAAGSRDAAPRNALALALASLLSANQAQGGPEQDTLSRLGYELDGALKDIENEQGKCDSVCLETIKGVRRALAQFLAPPSSAQTDRVWNEAVEASKACVKLHAQRGLGPVLQELSMLKRPLQAQEPQSRNVSAEDARVLKKYDLDAGDMVQRWLDSCDSAAGGTASPAAQSGAVDLPPLPEPYGWFDIRGEAADGYTAGQMRAYARAAVELSRAKQAAQPQVSDAHPQHVAALVKARDGWKEEAEKLRKDCIAFREQLDLRTSHQKNDVWFWQGDGTDYPESMGNSMAVVIRGDQLRALLSQPAAQTAGVPDFSEEAWEAKKAELSKQYPSIAGDYKVFHVAVITESGCDPSEGEFSVHISKLVHGFVSDDDLQHIRDAIWEEIKNLNLPEEGVTDVLVYESGEREDVFWNKYYRIAARPQAAQAKESGNE